MKQDIQPVIRRAESPADYRACQDAQRRAWGIAEEGYVVPIATLVGANRHGGLVLGAFLGDGTAVGLSFAFLGRIEGRIGLYSQLTGIVPEYQSLGLGYRLKQEQFAFARSEGHGVVAWAFDPLQAGNARFNLDKLGATVGRYIDDMYGPRSDALNAGSPTDRLLAVWESEGRRAAFAGDGSGLPRLVAAGPTIDDAPECRGLGAIDFPAACLVEFPASIGELRGHHPAAAERWRVAVRGAMREAFAAGYRAVATWRPEEGSGARRAGYVLIDQAGRATRSSAGA